MDSIITAFSSIGNRYLLRLNELKLTKGITPCLPKKWLERTRILTDALDKFFDKRRKSEYDDLPEESKYLVKKDYFPVDRIKDEFVTLMNEFPENRRTIVSFLLSTLLNNISKIKDGYRLFSDEKSNKALLLVDLALFIFAFSPTFDSTRKLISMIVYMNDEVNFKEKNSKENKMLENAIRRYSFVFQRGNLPDLCDLFPFFADYGLSLDAVSEKSIIKKAESENNPITWANILLYSKYYESFYYEVKNKVEFVVQEQISKMSDSDLMMQTEFWYALVYHNCPYISEGLRTSINMKIAEIQSKAQTELLGKQKN